MEIGQFIVAVRHRRDMLGRHHQRLLAKTQIIGLGWVSDLLKDAAQIVAEGVGHEVARPIELLVPQRRRKRGGPCVEHLLTQRDGGARRGARLDRAHEDAAVIVDEHDIVEHQRRRKAVGAGPRRAIVARIGDVVGCICCRRRAFRTGPMPFSPRIFDTGDDMAASAREIGSPGRGRVEGLGIAALADAVVHVGLDTVELGIEDEVDHAGNRVRAVRRRGAAG